ncbi:unnamed protein product [Blepharisma stoltei]|uniref:Uncharacterized protein n=1 Tax=Blepharisma stoltei TaxID=1481888 RepID=A0AAU9JX94_9CILI|nr:unnamed protein product [Blepharisma stoltei]
MFNIKFRQAEKVFQKIQAQVRTKSQIDRFLDKYTKEHPEVRDFGLTQEVWEVFYELIKDFRYRPWLYTRQIPAFNAGNEEDDEDEKKRLTELMEDDLLKIIHKHYEHASPEIVSDLMKWRENN